VVRPQLKAGVLGGVCRFKFLGNCLNYTRRSECHALALLKRSYQAAYEYVFHITVFLVAFWRGFGGVGAVYNARGWFAGV
jgi:hypothetical protein